MTTTHIFARVLGILYLCVGLGIFISPAHYRKLMREFLEQASLLYLGGACALVLGLCLVHAQSLFPWSLWSLLGIVGWLAILKGVVLLVYPRALQSMIEGYIAQPEKLRHRAVSACMLGGVFIYLGF